MKMEVSDPSIRREVEARLQRDLESSVRGAPHADPRSAKWVGHLVPHLLHVIWLLGQVAS